MSARQKRRDNYYRGKEYATRDCNRHRNNNQFGTDVVIRERFHSVWRRAGVSRRITDQENLLHWRVGLGIRGEFHLYGIGGQGEMVKDLQSWRFYGKTECGLNFS